MFQPFFLQQNIVLCTKVYMSKLKSIIIYHQPYGALKTLEKKPKELTNNYRYYAIINHNYMYVYCILSQTVSLKVKKNEKNFFVSSFYCAKVITITNTRHNRGKKERMEKELNKTKPGINRKIFLWKFIFYILW